MNGLRPTKDRRAAQRSVARDSGGPEVTDLLGQVGDASLGSTLKKYAVP